MKPWFGIIGLILDIIGVGILLKEEMTSLAAILKQSNSNYKGQWWENIAFRLANKFGSKESLDRENFVAESFPKKFWGFVCLLFGFLLQAISML